MAALLLLAISAALLTAYFLVRRQLDNQIDNALKSRAQIVGTVARRLPPTGTRPPGLPKVPPIKFGQPDSYVQLVSSQGTVRLTPGDHVQLPSSGALAVARGQRQAFFSDATVSGIHLRIYTAQIAGGAVEVARPLGDVDNTLSWIKAVFAAVSALAIATTAALGWLLSRAILRPVSRLTADAERIAETRDLQTGPDEKRADELGRLTRAFNTMLRALDDSLTAQRQLVADASHELRTPLTTARASLESMELHPELDPVARLTYLETAISELEEMTTLVDELMALAQGDAQRSEKSLMRLDRVAADAVAVAVRRFPNPFRTELEPTIIVGAASDLARAITNLLDNAAQWSPADSPIDVSLKDGVLTVRDHGSGVAPLDQPRVFDRFYRAADARTKRGSGLGLAIVRQTAVAHGGRASLVSAPGGGSVFSIDLSTQPLHVAADKLDDPSGRTQQTPMT